MSWLMGHIYYGISWVLLRWHEFWDMILPDGKFLGTTWDWVLAIVFLVVTVRIILFPIFVKQIKSQRAMQVLAPKVKALQAKHKGDPQTLREEMMKLYQTEKVNPLMGCLPMFLQIPVFFGLFHVLRYINPLAAQPNNPTGPPKDLYGWTTEQFDSAAQAQLFTAPIPASFSSNADLIAQLGGAHAAAAKLVAAVLVVMMMFTTFVTSRQMIMKTGWQQEPQQRMIQKLMLYGIPISLLLSGWIFPIGVVVYWVTQNLVSLGQQQWVLRKYPPIVTTPAAPKNARERAALASTKQPGAIKRFFLVLPPPATPTKSWFTKLMEKTGLRKPGQEPAQAGPAPRALAPRPGAKPRVAPVPASPVDDFDEADEIDEVDEPVEKRPARPAPGSGKVTPAKATPAKATPGKPAVAKPAPAKPAVAKTAAPARTTATTPKPSPATTTATARTAKQAVTRQAAQPAETTPTANGSTPNQASSANGSARTGGGAGQQRSGARKSTPARKGGQSGRKGGRR